jgi:multidrug resistance efflux pump
MTITFRPLRILWVLGLALFVGSVTGAGWLYHFSAGYRARAASADGLPPAGGPGIVCYGLVDVESGITSLYPLQPGRVAEVLVRENEAVAAGAPLLRLEDRAARLRVHEAQTALEAARTQLAQARQAPERHRSRLAQQRDAIAAVEHRLTAARHQLERKRELRQARQVTEADVAIAQEQVQELEVAARVEREKLAELGLHDPAQEVRRAEVEVDTFQVRLEQARHALDECVVKAPQAGAVLRILVGPGDVLSSPPTKPALLFCADGPRLVRAEVNQEFARRVAEGQPARVEDDVHAAATWRGRVLRVSDWYTQRRSPAQEPTELTDVRTVECLIALDAGQAPLRIGQRVRVTIGGPVP